jgi:hypothetical protein
MAAAVEMPEDQHFQQQPEEQGGGQRQREAEEEVAGQRGEARRQIGAHHVLGAVGEIDEVHDAEHQRQPGGHQEQEDAELQPVQGLQDEEVEHRCFTLSLPDRPSCSCLSSFVSSRPARVSEPEPGSRGPLRSWPDRTFAGSGMI